MTHPKTRKPKPASPQIIVPNKENWRPALFPKQMEVVYSRTMFDLVSGPRLVGKCIDGSTIIPCDGRLRRIKTLGMDVLPGCSAPLKAEITALATDGGTLLNANTSHIYRDISTEGLQITTHSQYAIRCSLWHPLWSFCDGQFAFRTSSEIRRLMEANKKVWLPLKRGFDWASTEYVTIRFSSNDKKLKKSVAANVRIESKLISHFDPKSTLNALARDIDEDPRMVRQYLEERFTLPVFSQKLTEDVAYLLGLLTGDGYLTDYRIGFSSADQSIVESANRILGEHFEASLKQRGASYNYDVKSARKLISLVLHLGLAVKSPKKRIPDAVVESPKSVVRAFLQGLFDTDGCALKRGHIEYCSASEPLARDTQTLLLMFGIRSSIKFRPNKCLGAWHLYIQGDAGIFYSEIGFRLHRKQNRSSALNKKMDRMEYPEDIRMDLKRLYLSRHSRGAERGNLPRSKKHDGFDSLYGKNGVCVSAEKLKQFISFSRAHNDPVLRNYYLEGHVFWEPVRSCDSCPVELFDFVVPKYESFIGGGFINHNSRAIGAAVLAHAWGAERGRVGIIAKSVKNAKVGTWDTLTTTVMDEWRKSGLKSANATFDWASEPNKKPGPRHEGDTRMNYFKVNNFYGGISEVQLHSLNCDNDIEDTMLDAEFSMIVFLELQKFEDIKIFNISVPQLRRAGVPSWKYRWLADTNPPESGPDHFAYKIWFIDRVKEIPETITDDAEKKMFLDDQKRFGLHLFDVNSNPHADPVMMQRLKSSYMDDPIGWDRFILGKWTKASSSRDYHFSGIFKREIHVMGDVSDKDQANWQILVPSHECTVLATGWDIGQACNHAFVIAEPVILENDQTAFSFLDECAHIGTQDPVVVFIEECLEKMYAIEKLVGSPVEFRNWSDSSAWQWSSKSDNVDAMLVEKLSLGRVILTTAVKAKKTSGVARRVKMNQDLFKQGRILISANCTQLIEMYENIRSGRIRVDGTGDMILKGSPFKHIWDAASYLLFMELYSELSEGPPQPQTSSRLISVAF